MSEQVQVRQYSSVGDFQGGCNDMLKDGYGLHSWRLRDYGTVVAVFVKMQNVPAKPEGMACR